MRTQQTQTRSKGTTIIEALRRSVEGEPQDGEGGRAGNDRVSAQTRKRCADNSNMRAVRRSMEDNSGEQGGTPLTPLRGRRGKHTSPRGDQKGENAQSERLRLNEASSATGP